LWHASANMLRELTATKLVEPVRKKQKATPQDGLDA
jgi:hypothetical protein